MPSKRDPDTVVVSIPFLLVYFFFVFGQAVQLMYAPGVHTCVALELFSRRCGKGFTCNVTKKNVLAAIFFRWDNVGDRCRSFQYRWNNGQPVLQIVTPGDHRSPRVL